MFRAHCVAVRPGEPRDTDTFAGRPASEPDKRISRSFVVVATGAATGHSEAVVRARARFVCPHLRPAMIAPGELANQQASDAILGQSLASFA